MLLVVWEVDCAYDLSCSSTINIVGIHQSEFSSTYLIWHLGGQKNAIFLDNNKRICDINDKKLSATQRHFFFVGTIKLKISHCTASLGKVYTDQFHVFVILPSKNVRN